MKMKIMIMMKMIDVDDEWRWWWWWWWWVKTNPLKILFRPEDSSLNIFSDHGNCSREVGKGWKIEKNGKLVSSTNCEVSCFLINLCELGIYLETVSRNKTLLQMSPCVVLLSWYDHWLSCLLLKSWNPMISSCLDVYQAFITPTVISPDAQWRSNVAWSF